MRQISDSTDLLEPRPMRGAGRGIVPVFADRIAEAPIPMAGDPRCWSAGKLPVLVRPERDRLRWVSLLLAAAIIAGFFCTAKAFWVPAHPGADQNGYLVGGKLLAEGQYGGLTPQDPYEFVGSMWVSTARGAYFPKYPIGLPAIYAACLRLGGSVGPTAAYLVSPILATAALLGVFLMIRRLLGSFAGVVGLLAMAASPDTFGHATNPNSHATTLFCVTWGFLLLLHWWRDRGWWRALVGAFLIGFAATVRYSEGMLLLPVLLIVLFNLRPNRVGDYVVSVLTLLAWAAPVGALLWYNRRFLGTWTGYDSTHESTGFALKYFLANWDVLLRTLSTSGLFFLLPLAAGGLVLLFGQNWRLAAVLTSWIVPAMVLYGSYYWAPDNVAALSYSRFFLTILPPLILCALYCLLRGGRPLNAESTVAGPPELRWTVGAAIAAGIVVALGSAVDAESATTLLAHDQITNLNLLTATDQVRQNIPAGATIFGDDNLLRELQFVGDWQLYDYRLFTRAYVDRMGRVDPDNPNPLQFQRARALYDQLSGKTDQQLTTEQIQLMTTALSSGQKVYMVVPPRLANPVIRRADATHRLDAEVVATWDDLSAAPAQPRKPAAPARPRRKGAAPDRGDSSWQILRITLRETGHPPVMPQR